MTKPTVYLAGPIAGCTKNQALDWRDDALDYFTEAGIRVLSPLRGKSHLLWPPGQEDTPLGDREDYARLAALCDARSILTRDFTDLKRSDLLFVNLLGVGKPSIGTAMEIGWAHAFHKPIVSVLEPGSPYDRHPMTHAALGGLRFTDLEPALECAELLLNG